jgi:ATP-dependent DNA helicase RecG
MRPSLLNPLFAGVAALPGIGPKLSPLFDRLLGDTGREARVLDVLFHLPHAVIDRSTRPCIADAPVDAMVTLEVVVEQHRASPPGRSRAPYRVLVADETGDVTLVFFNTSAQRMQSLLPVGETRWVSGRIELWEGRRQMVHPDRVLDTAGLARLPPFEPVYGATEGLYPSVIARAAAAALEAAAPARVAGPAPSGGARLADLRRGPGGAPSPAGGGGHRADVPVPPAPRL